MLEKNIRDMIQQVREEAVKDGISASISLHLEHSHLMRIGNNSVSLNTSESLTRLDVRVLNGRREATHTHLGEINDIETVRNALSKAAGKAKVATPKDYDPILEIVEVNIDERSQYDDELATLDPIVKAEAYKEIFRSLGNKLNFSGSWSSGVTEICVVSTSNENMAYHMGTDQQFAVVLKHPEKKWELSHNQTGWRASDFDVKKSISNLESYLSIYENNEGIRIKPGDYTVMFGEQAVAEIMATVAWTGFFGRGWEEKRTWTSQNTYGEKILGDNITFVDDPSNKETYMFSFDMAGKQRKPFTLIEKGLMRDLMYDQLSAAKYHKTPTGHNTGSMSFVLQVGSGNADPLRATGNMGEVLFIPALHYMNIPNISKGIMTASSRFSATMVRDGKIVAPIFSTRITDTFNNILENVETLSSRSVSVNLSNTYGRRSPLALSVPSYIICRGVKITDCAESF